jgi:hypothetical protein
MFQIAFRLDILMSVIFNYLPQQQLLSGEFLFSNPVKVP